MGWLQDVELGVWMLWAEHPHVPGRGGSPSSPHPRGVCPCCSWVPTDSLHLHYPGEKTAGES